MAAYCKKLIYPENYYIYRDGLVKSGYQVIHTNQITSETYDEFFEGVMNIFRDGIEEELVQRMMVNVIFDDGQSLELNIMDYFFNLIMWRMLIDIDVNITPTDLFDPENITQDDIKSWIDDRYLTKYRDENNILEQRGYDPETASIIRNRAMDNGVHGYSYSDEFALYLMNTICLEDDIKLWNQNPEYYNILHSDFSGIPIESVKDEGMKLTRRAADIIMNSNHCLRDSFRAKEGVNIKQYREYQINIGAEPDGKGSIWPYIINNSFVNGGVAELEAFFVESNGGRLAQIIAKCNVGTSGAFARILGLNNRDSILHHDPSYVCNSKHFEKITIKNATYLTMFNGRYYRENPRGVEKCLSKKDTHLIGKTIYFRSPMKCASAARGHGICYRCYGKLAYTNAPINIGQLAAELISSRLTQKQLSAKHLLEAAVIALVWNEHFYKFFDVEFNNIRAKDDADLTGCKIIINPDDIKLESEEDDYTYNEYVSQFQVELPNGERLPIYNKSNAPIYLSIDLNTVIRKLEVNAIEGDSLAIPIDMLEDNPIFCINLINNEFSATLERIKSTINLESVTCNFDSNEVLQEFIDAVKEGGLGTVAVHLEVILMNQLRSVDDILAMPDWSSESEECRVLTLNQALNNNPSITVSMQYKLSNVYYNPISFKKHKASYIDLLFMEKPQEFFQNSGLYKEPKQEPYKKKPIQLITWDNK